jgi:uncharacterized protein GlcG (DUF336 family)
MKKILFAGAILLGAGSGAWAQDWGVGPRPCSLSQTVVNNVLGQLSYVVTLNNGGLFSPNKMWAAVVDRQGVLCGFTRSSPDAWPGSRDIAIAKAFTANGFSNSELALSTANLYGPTQPGGSLYGLNNSNPFNSFFNPQETGNGFVVGGIITFGGGVALYSGSPLEVIGGLGVSGDTSCAHHAIAYRMRARAGYGTVPKGPFGPGSTDNISYYSGLGAGGLITSPVQVDPSQFKQPHCLGASDVTQP